VTDVEEGPSEEVFRIHAESTPLAVLIELVSERVTHMTLDWADGVCRAALLSGREEYIARGPNARVALARAMRAYDLDRSERTVTYPVGSEGFFRKVD
jgi:hypothetical protein